MPTGLVFLRFLFVMLLEPQNTAFGGKPLYSEGAFFSKETSSFLWFAPVLVSTKSLQPLEGAEKKEKSDLEAGVWAQRPSGGLPGRGAALPAAPLLCGLLESAGVRSFVPVSHQRQSGVVPAAGRRPLRHW